jgi:hypothetical protein
MKLILRRESQYPGQPCTLGFLLLAGLKLCTIERPWIPASAAGDKGGRKNLSCVPLGVYQLVRHNSSRHQRTWALVNHDLDVVHYEGDDRDPDEDRATCLIHVANYVHQVKGCIGVGHRVQKDGDGYKLCDSVKAMDLLRATVPWTDEHTLEIIEAAPIAT